MEKTRQVWKFPLEVTDRQTIDMPIGAEVLSVQTQNGQPCLWALVDPGQPKTGYAFRIFGTGHAVPEAYSRDQFIGTFQMRGGALVFHLFKTVRP